MNHHNLILRSFPNQDAYQAGPASTCLFASFRFCPYYAVDHYPDSHEITHFHQLRLDNLCCPWGKETLEYIAEEVPFS